jgi:hypothetical protein
MNNGGLFLSEYPAACSVEQITGIKSKLKRAYGGRGTLHQFMSIASDFVYVSPEANCNTLRRLALFELHGLADVILELG